MHKKPGGALLRRVFLFNKSETTVFYSQFLL